MVVMYNCVHTLCMHHTFCAGCQRGIPWTSRLPLAHAPKHVAQRLGFAGESAELRLLRTGPASWNSVLSFLTEVQISNCSTRVFVLNFQV